MRARKTSPQERGRQLRLHRWTTGGARFAAYSEAVGAMVLYSLLLLLVLAISAPVWGVRMLFRAAYRKGLRERLGGVPERLHAFVQGRPVVWVHAVSVGETMAAKFLIAALDSALPGHAILLSTTTETGQMVAEALYGKDRVFYYPFDFAFAVRAYLRALQPTLLVLMESELWPRMLHECAQRGVPVAVVNARVSDRSLPRYRALRALWRPLLQKITVLLAQSEQDAERWRSIGVPGDRVRCAGNLKYDIANDPDTPLVRLLCQHLPADARVLVAGSTHDGEELAALEAFAIAAGAEGAPALLILAPRHPQRCGDVAATVQRAGLVATPLSTWREAPAAVPHRAVLLVDTVGELASLYSLAAGAFVGGSLISRGGHNPLEAAQFGVPVATGPHYGNFRAMVDAMRAQKAVTIVQNGELALWFSDCLAAETQVVATGERARRFYESQRGATERTVEALVPLALQGRGS